jgi:hypothetical protein
MVEAVKAMGEWERGKPTPPIPPEEPKNWRVIGPWQTKEKALEDWGLLGTFDWFRDYEMEERK